MSRSFEASGNAAAAAYDALEQQIVTLVLAPGAAVTEAQLSDRTGFGRTPVREAVQRLSWQGLMEIRPRAGIVIAPLNAGDWLKITEVRRGIEPVLARSAALLSTRENSLPLRDAAVAMASAAAANDNVAFLQAGKLFDRAMAAIADNPFAVRAAGPLQTQSRRFWFRYRRVTGLAEIAGHHVAIIDAVIDGDAGRSQEETLRLIALLEIYARSVI